MGMESMSSMDARKFGRRRRKKSGPREIPEILGNQKSELIVLETNRLWIAFGIGTVFSVVFPQFEKPRGQ
jgi:hypothetical protein